MGRLNNAYDALCSQLTTAGLTVVNDSRNARPGTVDTIIDAVPAISAASGSWGDTDLPAITVQVNYPASN